MTQLQMMFILWKERLGSHNDGALLVTLFLDSPVSYGARVERHIWHKFNPFIPKHDCGRFQSTLVANLITVIKN